MLRPPPTHSSSHSILTFIPEPFIYPSQLAGMVRVLASTSFLYSRRSLLPQNLISGVCTVGDLFFDLSLARMLACQYPSNTGIERLLN